MPLCAPRPLLLYKLFSSVTRIVRRDAISLQLRLRRTRHTQSLYARGVPPPPRLPRAAVVFVVADIGAAPADFVVVAGEASATVAALFP